MEQSRTTGRPYAVAAGLLLAVLVAYLPALQAGFIWDDDAYVTDNRLLETPGGLARIWLDPTAGPQYYPLTFTTFWIERRLWGENPAGYHLVNILLHGAGAVVLYRILLLLGLPGAALGAALFALHPIQVESVAWITERKNVLSGFACLLSALTFLRWAGFGGTSPPRRRRALFIASLACFLLALLSKTVTATLPALLLILLWIGFQRPLRSLLPPLLPYFGLGAGAGLLTAWLERSHVGALGAAWDHSLPERALIAGRALWFYIGTLAWPANLSFVYPRWVIDASSPVQWLAPAAFLLAALLLWLARRRVGTLPLAALLAYAAALAPALGFLNVYPMLFSYVADHFAYLATIPALAAFGSLLTVVGRGLDRRTAGAAACLLLLLLGTLTWRQTLVYRDIDTLWSETIARNPDAWLAHQNLGVELLGRGEMDRAEWHFREVLRIDPGNPVALLNLGDLSKRRGKPEAALEHYRTVVELEPGALDAYLRLGETLMGLGRMEEAGGQFRRALEVDPAAARAHFGYGVFLMSAGDDAAALARFESTLAIDPLLADAHFNAGVLLARRGERDAAAGHYRKALSRDPGNLHYLNNLAAVEAEAGRLGEAASLLREAVRLHPDDPTATANLAEVTRRLAESGGESAR